MNHREVFDRRRGHVDMGHADGRNRERRKESERKMPDRLAEVRPIRPVPGINRIERCELRDARIVGHTKQIQPRIRYRARAIGKPDQRQHRALRPHLGVIPPRALQLRKRQNHVADRARPNQQTAQGYFKPYSLRAFSRRTMRASSVARSRVIS